MADFTVVNAGEKLIVGQLDMSFLTATDKLTPGTAVINGPCYIGLTPQVGVARATCMIGPPLPGLAAPVSLEVAGISNFAGITNTAGVINDTAVTNKLGFINKLGAEIASAMKAIFGLKLNNAAQITNGPKACNAVTTTPKISATFGLFGTCEAKLGVFASVAAPFKKFDIPHPIKEGYRLVHTCLEGPEIGVYYRGRLTDSNVIELPDYWRGLVDPETITISLTPHSFYQELYVKNIEWGCRINIVNNAGGPVDCSYIVYGERKDVDKLIVEYKEEKNNNYPEEI
jgi:hypothetical protein